MSKTILKHFILVLFCTGLCAACGDPLLQIDAPVKVDAPADIKAPIDTKAGYFQNEKDQETKESESEKPVHLGDILGDADQKTFMGELVIFEASIADEGVRRYQTAYNLLIESELKILEKDLVSKGESPISPEQMKEKVLASRTFRKNLAALDKEMRVSRNFFIECQIVKIPAHLNDLTEPKELERIYQEVYLEDPNRIQATDLRKKIQETAERTYILHFFEKSTSRRLASPKLIDEISEVMALFDWESNETVSADLHKFKADNAGTFESSLVEIKTSGKVQQVGFIRKPLPE